jgi:CTP synthase (UTP-ammonia lyase)
MRTVHIGIVGDFERSKHSHWATEAALFQAAARLALTVVPVWIPTTSVEQDVGGLAECDGIWGAPGSPFRSMRGMLRGIEHARTSNVPYLGTCAGFQYALVEFTRNVLGIEDADSAENDPDGENIVITPVYCEVPGNSARLDGEGVVRPVPGSLFEKLCGNGELRGEFFCSFETNEAFVTRWEAAGLRAAARGLNGEMRALELPSNRFFMATLFQPQLSSSVRFPHPIVEGFLRACASRAA